MKPLSFPTGPGWWWARRGGKWEPVNLCQDVVAPGEKVDWVEVTGSDLGREVDDFDAWLPLPLPKVNP